MVTRQHPAACLAVLFGATVLINVRSADHDIRICSPAPQAREKAKTGDQLALTLETPKHWHKQDIRVKFLDGDPVVWDKVRRAVEEWSNHSIVKFIFADDGTSDVRISFRGKGSWSAVGTDAMLYGDKEPTMNLGWLTKDTSDEEYSRVVLHEFGHALGFLHEHQNPVNGILWDEPAVYAYFKSTQGWSAEEVERNVLRPAKENTTNFTAFDPKSIMCYAIPRNLTKNGFTVGWNNKLSVLDKAFVGNVYGAPDPLNLPPIGRYSQIRLGHGDSLVLDVNFQDGKNKYYLICVYRKNEKRVWAPVSYGPKPKQFEWKNTELDPVDFYLCGYYKPSDLDKDPWYYCQEGHDSPSTRRYRGPGETTFPVNVTVTIKP